MSISKERKQELVLAYGAGEKDTGSSSVQIAIMTEHINQLTEHLKLHRKDNHTRRGLVQIINKRNKLLQYIYKEDKDSYRTLVKKLGIRAKYDRHHG